MRRVSLHYIPSARTLDMCACVRACKVKHPYICVARAFLRRGLRWPKEREKERRRVCVRERALAPLVTLALFINANLERASATVLYARARAREHHPAFTCAGDDVVRA